MSPQFGDIAKWYSQHNPAEGMFSPEGYGAAEDRVQGGMNRAGWQQDAMGRQADRYDTNTDEYDNFARGVGGQLSAGQDRLQGGVDKQQHQASWLWDNPGYSGGEKQSMMTAAATPIAGAYTAEQGDLRNTAARTGNSAGYGAQASELARNKARDLSMVGLGMQGGFADKRIEGQQFATGAQGAANDAQAGANAMGQSGAGLQGNLYSAGANMRQGGAQMRGALANSHLDVSKTAQGSQGLMQNAGALSMAPGQLAAQMYGTIQNGRTGALGAQTNLATQPGFLKQLALGAVGGLHGSYSLGGGGKTN